MTVEKTCDSGESFFDKNFIGNRIKNMSINGLHIEDSDNTKHQFTEEVRFCFVD